MFKKIYHSQAKSITFAAILLAGSGVLSRFLGLLRDRLLAGNFGAGEDLDIYFAAFRIPDFVYGILIAGGVGTAFLPVFSQYFSKENGKWSKESLDFTNNVLNCSFFILISICLFLAVFAPLLINIITPGFSEEAKSLTTVLTRIMLLSPIIFGLSGIFSGILHYFDRFLAYSLAPIFYNLGIIFGILFFVPFFGIFGLAYGVILGAMLHLGIQLPAAKMAGFRYRPVLNFNFPGVRKLFGLMAPRMMGVAVTHINLIIVTAIASTLLPGSITIFNFSNNLYYFPVGIIGVSFAVSSFPVFSKLWASGRKEEFFDSLSSSIRQVSFFLVPASFLIFILRAQIVRLVLGTGEFGWEDTRLTAASLGIFAFGIFASGLIPLFGKAFFALHNTKTPVIIGIISMSLNVLLSLFFVFLLKQESVFSLFFVRTLKLSRIESIEVIGLPLALSLSAVFHFFLLVFFFYRKAGNFRLGEIGNSFLKIVAGSVIMSFFAYFSLQTVSLSVDMSTFFGIMAQTLFALFMAGFSYLVTLILLESPEIRIIKNIFKK